MRTFLRVLVAGIRTAGSAAFHGRLTHRMWILVHRRGTRYLYRTGEKPPKPSSGYSARLRT